jgi:hypothetical protein
MAIRKTGSAQDQLIAVESDEMRTYRQDFERREATRAGDQAQHAWSASDERELAAEDDDAPV